MMKEQGPRIEEYSPTQSPLQIGEEQITGEQVEQLGSQGGVFITQAKLNEGSLQEPPMSSLNLIETNYKGRELDPVMEQASHEFLSDDNFVKSRAFYQFSWRSNMGKFEERCNKLKSEHLEIEDLAIESQIKNEMM